MTTLTTGDPRHGALNGYINLGCRCDECRMANAEAQRDRRSRRRLRLELGHNFNDDPRSLDEPTRHNSNTYLNWGCRCEVCRTAHAAMRKAQSARANERCGVTPVKPAVAEQVSSANSTATSGAAGTYDEALS